VGIELAGEGERAGEKGRKITGKPGKIDKTNWAKLLRSVRSDNRENKCDEAFNFPTQHSRNTELSLADWVLSRSEVTEAHSVATTVPAPDFRRIFRRALSSHPSNKISTCPIAAPI